MSETAETKINWSVLSPAYRISFDERMARWETEYRKEQIEDLRFFRDMRKKLREDEALSGETAGSEVLDDIIYMLVEKLEQ